MSIRRQCELLGLNRSSWYYEPAGETAENLALMRRLDEQYMATPFYGSRKLAEVLGVNRKRVQRLMRLMGLEAIYPRPRTTLRVGNTGLIRICCGRWRWCGRIRYGPATSRTFRCRGGSCT